MLLIIMVMVTACAHPSTGIAEKYAEPITPVCVKELFETKFNPIPATIIKGKSLGFFDFRSCNTASIGVAWVKEKRLRIKYSKQVDILNGKQ